MMLAEENPKTGEVCICVCNSQPPDGGSGNTLQGFQFFVI